jgi:preprotein translocase SecE subunit
VARDRQRAKQRQAERRAKRLAAQGIDPEADAAEREAAGPEAAEPEVAEPQAPEGAGSADLAAVPPREDGRPEPHLAASAPSEHLGQPDAVIEDEPVLDDDEELEDYDFEDEQQPLDGDEGYAPRGRRGDIEADRKRPRVIQFLLNCWAELQRVEWPKRQQLITLSWVVIGFVIIAGGFLGLLDAIFSQLVQAFL